MKGKAGSKGKTKAKRIDMDGSYLSPQPTTSSIVDTMQGNSMVSPLPHSDVISLLHRIEQSNKELIQQVKKMEKQNASVTRSSSPVTVPRAGVNSQNVLTAATSCVGGPAGQQGHPMAVDPSRWRQQAQGFGQDVAVGQQAGASHRPPPTLEAVRSSSEGWQQRQDEGKAHRYGRVLLVTSTYDQQYCGHNAR